MEFPNEMTLADLATKGWTREAEGAFVALIGPIWNRSVDGRRLFGVTIAPHHMNRDGNLHGGMMLGLFDHALGIAASEASDVRQLVTVQLNTHFISVAKQGWFIELHAEVVNQTGSLLFMRGKCVCGGRPLAAADGVWKKFRPRTR